jgi:hypothetical protein
MWRRQAMAVGVAVMMCLVVGMNVSHGQTLYYNITGVHALALSQAGLLKRPGPVSSCPAKAGHPVRRGFSIQSLRSLEYWIVRRSLSSGVHSRDPLADDDD